jgi:hypothetical protein
MMYLNVFNLDFELCLSCYVFCEISVDWNFGILCDLITLG